MLELAKNAFARLLWLAKTVLKEAGVIQIWFSHVPWKEDRAHADKDNMMENRQQYLLMGFQTGVLRMIMLKSIKIQRASPSTACKQVASTFVENGFQLRRLFYNSFGLRSQEKDNLYRDTCLNFCLFTEYNFSAHNCF